jgi:hypothetical protein
MNNVPRQALRDIITKYGTEVCSNRKRCEGLLRDNCSSFRREISILINALDERVPLDLMAGGNSVPRELLLSRLAKRLEDNLALTEEAAVWAVESWALALNIITDAEVAERENKRRKNNAPLPNASNDLDSENRIRETESKNLPPKIAPQKQPPKTNQPPVFTPPPNSTRQTNIPIGIQNPQKTAPPVPAGKTASQVNQAQTKDPRLQTRPKPRSRRLRGCLIGCFLLLILLGILAAGVPYAYRVMLETQQTSEPPRFPPQ